MTDALKPSSTETVRRILEERALRLAKPRGRDERDDEVKVVVINVGGERYGIDVHHIREIYPVDDLIRVPGLPFIWAGLINVRGLLYPVLDVARYLGLDPGTELRRHVVMIFSEELVVGLLANDVTELRSVTSEELKPPLDIEGQSRRAVSGATTDLVLLLDTEALLQDRSLIVDDMGSRKGV